MLGFTITCETSLVEAVTACGLRFGVTFFVGARREFSVFEGDADFFAGGPSKSRIPVRLDMLFKFAVQCGPKGVAK